ncbi:MAG: hypothetical protein KGJ01_00090 [Patescibacteria group bacterium]|nr:hypothetical protein [Patescibacteria group bacterium]
MKSYDKLKKISDKGGVVEFQAEIPLEILENNMEVSLDEAAADFEAPGFRKGKVPKEIVRQSINEFKLLDSAADASLYDAINEIIEDEKLNVLGSPEIYITKIAVGSPVEFKIKLALYPNISLPDYKAIGKEVSDKKEAAVITDKEVDDAISQIQQVFAGQDGENQSEKKNLPEINDEFVKKVSSLNTVAELREEVKKRLAQEKDIYSIEKNRDEIISEIIKKTKIEVPSLLIDQELHHLSHDREHELEKVGITTEEYLKQVKKTPEEMEKDDRKGIEERLKSTLILQEIRKKEDIKAEAKEIEEETQTLQKYYPDQDRNTLVRSAEVIVVQRKLFSVLESKKQ